VPNIARKSFWTHLMVLLGDESQVDARFGLFRDSANLIHLETVLVSVQDRSMVCAKHTSKIVLDAPDGTSR
jgi:hypothetical protein